jgi:hypothetical protein
MHYTKELLWFFFFNFFIFLVIMGFDLILASPGILPLEPQYQLKFGFLRGEIATIYKCLHFVELNNNLLA